MPVEHSSPLPPGCRWVILCRVVDNYGDAGVCWRLARQLAREHHLAVTLYIDRPELIVRLAGGPGPYEGVAVLPWPRENASAPAADPEQSERADGEAGRAQPGSARLQPDVIVSAFGADPPPALRPLLAGAPRRPLWLNLEYLSAEDWIESCHGLNSIKREDGAREHFFYPGFTPASGGLLRERDAVIDMQVANRASMSEARISLLQSLDLPQAQAGERLFTLFCYPEAPLGCWLPELAASPHRTLLFVPQGVTDDAVGRFAGRSVLAGETPVERGTLRLARIPFLSQDDYDRLLRIADLNIVRGEDSWIRAHWAGRPFIWQPYRQDDGAHRTKLDAFLERFRAAALSGAEASQGGASGAGIASVTEAIVAMMRAWSSDDASEVVPAWRVFEAQWQGEAIDLAFRCWNAQLLEQGDLAGNLVSWVASRL